MRRSRREALSVLSWPVLAALLLLVGLPRASAGAAVLQTADRSDIWRPICEMIDRAAAANHVPAGFLTRILWQESRFHSGATSPAGAIGIAQFMPQTAAERGLADPREPGSAIANAAQLLAELKARFGNFGLAAAGYNAGAARVARWLNRQSDLPAETRSYVALVTERPAESWAIGGAAPGLQPGERASCLDTMAGVARSGTAPSSPPTLQVKLDQTLEGAIHLFSALDADRSRTPPRVLRGVEGLCTSLRSLGARCAVFQH